MKKIICYVLLLSLLSPSFLAAQSADYPLSSIQRIQQITEELRTIDQERELLKRIGEYEQREKDRIGAENRRIEAERRRIEQTEKRLGALRELDRRAGDLYEELAIEAGILQDYFYNSKREYFNAIGHNSINSKIDP